MQTAIVEQAGLSSNEAKVYFALLELDQSTATPIVKKSGIPNSKIYPVLEKLISKGLVSYVVKNNVKYFQASDTRSLIDMLDKKENEIRKQKKEMEKFVEQIELKRKLAKQKQEATVYEGISGVKAALNTMLNSVGSGNEYNVFTLGEELAEKPVINFLRNFHKKRRMMKVNARLVANSSIRSAINRHYGSEKLKIRFTSAKLPTGVFIYNDCVMTVVWGEAPTAFVIKSASNAQRYKDFFEQVWRNASA